MNETPRTESPGGSRLDRTRLLAWVLGVLGAALAGYGAYTHLSIAARANCDGCAPWHPLFVVAPLVLGGLLLVAAGVARYRA